LILEKIINIVAAGCHILRLKCTKFDVGLAWPLPQNPLRECSPDPLVGFKGPTSKGKERTERKGGLRKEVERGDIAQL